MKDKRLLILSDGKPGHVNQSIAFARYLGLPYALHRVSFKYPAGKALSYLLDRVGIYSKQLFITDFQSGEYSAVVSTGSGTYYANRTLARLLGCKSVAVMLPKGYRFVFDLIIAQQHDNPPVRPNIVTVPINLNYVEPQGVVKPQSGNRYIALIIGGDSRHLQMDVAFLQQQVVQILALFPEHEVWLTTSPRTPLAVEQMLRQFSFSRAVYYSAEPVNPIPDFLEYSDYVFLTADSSSMISEAISFGRSCVEVLPPSDHLPEKSKVNKLISILAAQKCLHLFDGSIASCQKKIFLADIFNRQIVNRFESNPMKVLQVTAALDQGGVERGTVEMADFIISQGGESFVASQGGRLVKDLEEGGTKHFLLPLARRNPLAILSSAWQLRKIIRRENIDLLHARSRAPAWATFFAGKMTGVKMVTTFHGTHRIQNRVKKWYNSIMVRGVRVIAISAFIKNHILQNYTVNEELIDIAPRGFNPALFDPDRIDPRQRQALKQQLGLTEETAIISLPGRLTRWKGQILFLEALAQLKEPKWQALLIGGGGKKTNYVNELKIVAEKFGIGDRVIFVGNQDDIVPYYAISDLVVSASTEPEAFGRVAVEAQAMAKPIIASAHGGSLETVKDGETGWLFANGDVIDLTDKLSNALSGKVDLSKIGEAGRQWVTENYTIDKMCQKEWDAYLKVPGISAG